MIIALSGQMRSGKGEVARILEEDFGFIHISFSNFLKNDLQRAGLEANRENLQNLANRYRKEYGTSYLARRALEKIDEYRKYDQEKNFVLESIRNPGEAKLLLQNNADLWAIKADQKKRYERTKLSEKGYEATNYKDFLKAEKKENSKNSEFELRIEDVEKLSKTVILNNGTLETLRKKVRTALEAKTGKKLTRPTWDEYFLDLAKQVGSRSTCNRGRAGCVIVRDNHILVTGYAGSPRGTPHCDDDGHEMKGTLHEDGRKSNHCVRTSHAEQNAICQAAKMGISLDGATIYVRMAPCYTCAKMLINCGIKRVIAKNDYHGSNEAKKIFKIAGIKLDVLEKGTVTYHKM